MTTEEKAKAYDEALERARKIHDEILNNEILGFPEQIREIFPQLRESEDEDERIRKEIIEFVDTTTLSTDERHHRWIAYLEKQKEQNKCPEFCSGHCVGCEQKEQKPAEKQDYSGLNDLERAIHRGFLVAGVENVPVTIIKETAAECMGFLALIEPKPAEWSEEDEKMLNDIIGIIAYAWGETSDRVSWLKSLRPSWKPSREQIEALKDAKMRMSLDGWGLCPLLQSLINELEKL